WSKGSGRDRAVTRFRAPATTANLGPGFDAVGAALDLWNELELTEGDGAEEIASWRAGLRRLRTADIVGLPLDKPDSLRARRRLECGDRGARPRRRRVGGAGRAECGGVARCGTPTRGARRQSRGGAGRWRLPDVGGPGCPNRGPSAGAADCGHPGDT